MFSYTVFVSIENSTKGRGKGLLGVEYMAAMPARKSLARALPPVAEAEYGPYAATM